MPINRTHGELIDALGPDYAVMPTELYVNLPEFKEACDYAIEKFKDSQAVEWPIRFGPDDIVVQLYPNIKPAPLLVFIFCKRCRGGLGDAEGPKREAMSEERFVTYQFSVVGPNVNAIGHA